MSKLENILPAAELLDVDHDYITLFLILMP